MFLFLFIIKNTSAIEKKNFVISTSHPQASKIGRDILNKGGSAMDAVLAVQMALNLVEPQSSGIGGGGFLLYFDKKSSHLSFYDGREIAPSKIKKEFFLSCPGGKCHFIILFTRGRLGNVMSYFFFGLDTLGCVMSLFCFGPSKITF